MNETKSATNPALAHLAPLIGEWQVTVTVEGTEYDAGSASFDWLEDGAFIIYRSKSPAPYPSGVIIIGGDDSTGRCAGHYFDSRGVARLYEMSMIDGVWKQWREAPGFSQRFSGAFSADGDTIDARWEICEDGETWRLDFNLAYRRVTR